jgi:hypothetical protein
MYIFIDEAGSFQTTTRPHAVSCVAALVVPEPFAPTGFRRFRRCIRPWVVDGAELKGSRPEHRTARGGGDLRRRPAGRPRG